jgi:hypothetical protein
VHLTLVAQCRPLAVSSAPPPLHLNSSVAGWAWAEPLPFVRADAALAPVFFSLLALHFFFTLPKIIQFSRRSTRIRSLGLPTLLDSISSV